MKIYECDNDKLLQHSLNALNVTRMQLISQVGMVSKTDLKNNKSPFLHYVAMGIP